MGAGIALSASAFAANSLWLASAWSEARRFHRDAAQPACAQERLLANILRANRNTEYGRRYDFGSISSIEEFQRRVPLTTYDDYSDAIERMAHGAQNILTAERVRLFEPSSGSTKGTKLIPYTRTLQTAFQRGLAPWISDTFRHHPSLLYGPAYWSVTPLTEGRRTTPAGIPIGFEEDSSYLGLLAPLVESALAVPNSVKHCTSIETFRYLTLLFLLRTPALRLISIWNPTFLTLLLRPLATWWQSLLSDIDAGTITPPEPLAPEDESVFRRRLLPNPARARALSDIALTSPAGLYRAIWPHLSLISCWTDGPSISYARQLAQDFPDTIIQGKGLIATEAFVSFPLRHKRGSILSIRSHFFEFLGEDGKLALAHELQPGCRYTVVVTTGGGFYRYHLHDRIEMVDRYRQTPCIRFLGKTDHISDHFGEKLHEDFIIALLDKLCAYHNLTPRFSLLAPAQIGDTLAYTLYIELPQDQQPNLSASQLDELLCSNFHYAYCRRLGQLGPARIHFVENGTDKYLSILRQRGLKLGNIKPAVLDSNPGWEQYLALPNH